jgi:hypothetical protein
VGWVLFKNHFKQVLISTLLNTNPIPASHYSIIFQAEANRDNKMFCLFASASDTGKLDDYELYYLQCLRNGIISAKKMYVGTNE